MERFPRKTESRHIEEPEDSTASKSLSVQLLQTFELNYGSSLYRAASDNNEVLLHSNLYNMPNDLRL